MAKIEYLTRHHPSKERAFERIVAAAQAEAGLWLMIKEREMELRALKAEAGRLGVDLNDFDRLRPALLELTESLVSRIFGNCPPETLPLVQEALLDAARLELDASRWSMMVLVSASCRGRLPSRNISASTYIRCGPR